MFCLLLYERQNGEAREFSFSDGTIIENLLSNSGVSNSKVDLVNIIMTANWIVLLQE